MGHRLFHQELVKNTKYREPLIFEGFTIFPLFSLITVSFFHSAYTFCEEKMFVTIRKILILFSLAGLAFGLIACAEEEQNRLLSYKKGTYLGKADQQLSEEQLRQLVRRSNGQRAY